MQKRCIHLGRQGKNINNDIRARVAKGLSAEFQQGIDVLRVVGNNAVHRGQIDPDDPSTVRSLFVLINIIVGSMVSVP
jgi:hypothetical protein